MKKEIVEKVLQTAQIVEVISDYIPLKKKGKSHIGDCPFCNAKNGLNVTPEKDIWKCFNCGEGKKGAVSFVMAHEGIEFIDAVKQVAQKYAIDTEDRRRYVVKTKKGVSFRDAQLKASGIPLKYQKFKIRVDDRTVKEELDRYESGGIDEYWNIVSEKDDMILNYVELNGELIHYRKDAKSKPRQFFRIRFKNPELPENRTKDGKVRKYAQPGGSGTHPWIPNKMLELYARSEEYKTMHIIEGEKKSDKMCLHGLPTIGIGGILNLAHQQVLPKEFRQLISRGKPKNIIFWLDADWQDLGDNLETAADNRPYTFYAAVRNFRDYFYALANEGLYLNLYFGYLKKDAVGTKGMDDLLAGELSGKEEELREDIEKAIIAKNGEGERVCIHNITELTQRQLKEFWHLESPQSFIRHYKEELKDLEKFRIGKFDWKIDEKGEATPANPIGPHEQYWIKEEWEDRQGNLKTKYIFDPQGIRVFLRNRGFGRLKMSADIYKFIEIQGKVVREVTPQYIKDYVIDYTENVVQNKDVLRMLLRASSRYFGPDQLSNMYVRNLEFMRNDSETQYIFFEADGKRVFWKITRDGISEKPINELPGYVWEDKIKKGIRPQLLPHQMYQVREYDAANESIEWEGSSMVRIDAEGKKKEVRADFADFLMNTSNFHWAQCERQFDKLEEKEKKETILHFFNKLSAIGYLLHRFRDPNIQKAVVAMDGKLSEVGRSEGRSGKSILGDALMEVINGHYLNGKTFDPMLDRFAWEGIDERTDIVFIDDVRVNLNFEALFPVITGRFEVNPKGQSKYYIPKELTPKIYLTTNHAIGGHGGSFEDRQTFVAFSDYYSSTYKPLNEFEQRFFDDWGYVQWSLFYNLMASALQIYFQHGLIEPPMERLEKRKLRQEIGETFVQWADGFFDPESGHRNKKHERKALMMLFLDEHPQQKRYVDSRRFKDKIRGYAQYRDDLTLNPHVPPRADGSPGDWKTGGHEYFVLADEHFDAGKILSGALADEPGAALDETPF